MTRPLWLKFQSEVYHVAGDHGFMTGRDCRAALLPAPRGVKPSLHLVTLGGSELGG